MLVYYSCFCFLRPPPPPTSTLFPYTTLFRSPTRSTSPPISARWPRPCSCSSGARRVSISLRLRWFRSGCRSEEHTSELQSHSDLVCRLLLEKKNKMNSKQPHSFTVTPSFAAL